MAQNISFFALNAKTYGDAPFIVSATASSSLPVALSIVSGPASISGSLITITGAGTVTVRASQTGNDSYEPAPNVDQSFVVGKGNQTINFVTLPGKTYGDAPFAISASASSGLPVSFIVMSGPANISANTITITGAGSVIVRASQAGNANYHPAPNVDQTFTVGKKSQVV